GTLPHGAVDHVVPGILHPEGLAAANGSGQDLELGGIRPLDVHLGRDGRAGPGHDLEGSHEVVDGYLVAADGVAYRGGLGRVPRDPSPGEREKEPRGAGSGQGTSKAHASLLSVSDVTKGRLL